MPLDRHIQFCMVGICFLLMHAFLTPAYANERLELSWEQAKAHYSLEIIKHTHWPNDEAMDSIRIGILGEDAKISQAFQSRSQQMIRDKKIVVSNIKPQDFNANDYDAIFITERMRGHYEAIFSQSIDTLLISDGAVDKTFQLYSLVQGHEALKITFNRDNLTRRNFEPSINLLSFAGTKEDLSNHLHEQKSHLETLQNQVSEKEQNLNALNQALSKNNTLLESAESLLAQSQFNLSESKSQLHKLIEEVKASEQKLQTNASDLRAQKQDIETKQKEIKDREHAISELSSKIEENRAILEEQNEKIAEQLVLLNARQHVIGTQRNLLFTAFFIVGIFVLLSYILLRINQLRHAANQKLKKLNSQLYELATTDGLTGLFNRKHFLESAQTEFTHCQRSTTESVLMMADIDHFKSVNDTYGHHIGDKVIQALANILKNDLRPYDIVGRLGGEEFAMMLIDCNLKRAEEIAERLREHVAKNAIEIASGKIHISISIGLSRVESDDLQVQDALKRADKALYHAKDRGRNCVKVYNTKTESA